MALDIIIDDLQRIRDVRIGSAPIAPRMNGKSAALHLTHGRRILKWTVDGRAFKILIEGDMSEEKLNLTPKYPWVQVKGSLSVVWLHPISPASRPRSSRSRLEELPMVSDEFLNEQLNAVYRSQTHPSSWLSLR